MIVDAFMFFDELDMLETRLTELDGLVDLLMNFDEYAKRQTSVKGLVREPTTSPAEQPTTSSAPPNDRAARR